MWSSSSVFDTAIDHSLSFFQGGEGWEGVKKDLFIQLFFPPFRMQRTVKIPRPSLVCNAARRLQFEKPADF